MSGKYPRLNPLASRKQLLIAESELNRVQLVQEWHAMADEARSLAYQARTLRSFASAAATLVAGLTSCRQKTAPPAAEKPSWGQTRSGGSPRARLSGQTPPQLRVRRGDLGCRSDVLPAKNCSARRRKTLLGADHLKSHRPVFHFLVGIPFIAAQNVKASAWTCCATAWPSRPGPGKKPANGHPENL